ncbi:uncharacterized protein LOC111378862 [Olea europaea var. sylvestris]|uniref:uncharacterized protein LOC111378862 n=1 Tax=Olea europaea var. sylvestris TaxID=158386 RepID=UPI000C1D168E|nr:uncharacterized protein LOC111378862 [Olea europaea var. sylvestris]
MYGPDQEHTSFITDRGEVLKLYLSVSEHAISAALTQEENDVQHPIYYVSKALHEIELRYSLMGKLAFTLLMAARKLRPYFFKHPTEVLANSPLRQTLQRLDTSGRMIKWTVELGQFDIKYTPRSSIKDQALADFISEFCSVPIEELLEETPWELYIDGSSTRDRSRASVVLISPEQHIFCEALPFDFKASNNEVEYEALIIGVNDVYQMKEERMNNYLGVVRKELKRFNITQVKKILQSQNGHADTLASLATSEGFEEFDSIPMGRLSLPITELIEVILMMIDPKPTWQDEIIPYLKIGKCPKKSTEARKLRIRLARYTLIDNVLYKQGYSMPLLRFLKEEAQHALRDIQEGICENHSGGLFLAHKIIRQGYFWSAIRRDVFEFVKRYDKCQRLVPS